MSETRLSTPEPGGRMWRRRQGWLRRRRSIVHRPRGEVVQTKRIRLWLPLTPLWVLLAPFALLLAPALTLLPPLLPDNRRARAARKALAIRPYRTVFAIGAVLLAMSGTVVEVEAPGAVIHIRIF